MILHLLINGQGFPLKRYFVWPRRVVAASSDHILQSSSTTEVLMHLPQSFYKVSVYLVPSFPVQSSFSLQQQLHFQEDT